MLKVDTTKLEELQYILETARGLSVEIMKNSDYTDFANEVSSINQAINNSINICDDIFGELDN